jgi:alkanesulfonate monooxygenase SsuD/methylene tetrahydromethanopterin reductase-like flavin-dependent oxidoreductase (luciferase family)
MEETAMDFGFYLPCYWPDTSYHAANMYRDVVQEVQAAEDIGCISLSVPEHHFINYLVHPSPLLTAVRVAAATRRIPIITAVLVLPFYAMRRLAGEIAQADCLTGGRIELRVGRGAFRYEFDAFGVPVEEARDRFDDSLDLLIKLLSETEICWDSKYDRFGPLTITPRPLQLPYPPIWIAALDRPSIMATVRRGFHVMTTPLRDPMDVVRMQAGPFFDALPRGSSQPFSMLRMGYVAANEDDARGKVAMAYANHQRFVNVFTTQGTARQDEIVPLEVEDMLQDIESRLIIGTAEQCVDRLGPYAELGIHNIQLNMNFGTSHVDVMNSLERFAAKMMPHFVPPRQSLEPNSQPWGLRVPAHSSARAQDLRA